MCISPGCRPRSCDAAWRPVIGPATAPNRPFAVSPRALATQKGVHCIHEPFIRTTLTNAEAPLNSNLTRDQGQGRANRRSPLEAFDSTPSRLQLSPRFIG
jgi:hypothetical protein